MQNSDSSPPNSFACKLLHYRLGGVIVVLQKSFIALTRHIFLDYISHLICLHSNQERPAGLHSVGHHTLFCEITDSSILCITWINLQNCLRSLWKVQDAVDQWGSRHIAGRLNCFLQRRSETSWRISANFLNIYFYNYIFKEGTRQMHSYLDCGIRALSWWLFFVCIRNKTGQILSQSGKSLQDVILSYH